MLGRNSGLTKKSSSRGTDSVPHVPQTDPPWLLIPMAEGIFRGGAYELAPDVCGRCWRGEYGLAWTGRKYCWSEWGEGMSAGRVTEGMGKSSREGSMEETEFAGGRSTSDP